ncbi:hypothetical protein [Paenibacillus alvei]|uniref:hypothetical protein n=1 Tax=Paenibacillus alvei TaxID=44250 RepID=UPI0013D99689|nr:hypothetical protein [Paenibacillus alvei]NEZ45453.1 hypothetical protein [Paenibacillus alvei]
MKAESISKLLDVMTHMLEKQKEINEVLNTDSSLFEFFAEKIRVIIMDDIGIPADNTVEMIQKYGDPEGYFSDETFSRDSICDWIYEYEDGTITKEKLIFNLLNWETLLASN